MSFDSELININRVDGFDAIICLNANLPDAETIRSFGNIPILAADGAAMQLLEMDVSPDYIIGDLDSFTNSSKYKAIDENRLIFKPDQETNDFEKNLVFAIEHNWNKLLILGIHGGQLEHTLNNWSVLKKYATKMNLTIFDQGRYGFVLHRGSYRIKTKIRETISLIPQPKAKLSSKNLKWELCDEYLELGVREGARNEAVDDNIEISISEGEILIFIDGNLSNSK